MSLPVDLLHSFLSARRLLLIFQVATALTDGRSLKMLKM